MARLPRHLRWLLRDRTGDDLLPLQHQQEEEHLHRDDSEGGGHGHCQKPASNLEESLLKPRLSICVYGNWRGRFHSGRTDSVPAEVYRGAVPADRRLLRPDSGAAGGAGGGERRPAGWLDHEEAQTGRGQGAALHMFHWLREHLLSADVPVPLPHPPLRWPAHTGRPRAGLLRLLSVSGADI